MADVGRLPISSGYFGHYTNHLMLLAVNTSFERHGSTCWKFCWDIFIILIFITIKVFFLSEFQLVCIYPLIFQRVNSFSEVLLRDDLQRSLS